MKRYLIIFQGRVQGVGFRYFIYQTARTLKMTGKVRNMVNGHVECEIQGDSEAFDRFLELVMKGNGFIRVEDYSLKELPVIPDEKAFKIVG
jgi:acylphosphatase